MIKIVAPDNRTIDDGFLSSGVSIFVAGGITNCPDWQTEYIAKFNKYDDNIMLFNPRRYDFDVTKPNMSSEQVEWEHQRISESDAISFWFPCETLCPITLYELGIAVNSKEKIFVGCHPDYGRKFDVVKQLSLSRPDVEVVFSLDDLANQVYKWLD